MYTDSNLLSSQLMVKVQTSYFRRWVLETRGGKEIELHLFVPLKSSVHNFCHRDVPTFLGHGIQFGSSCRMISP